MLAQKDLIPINKRTKDEQKKIAKRAGIVSEKQEEKKGIKKAHRNVA